MRRPVKLNFSHYPAYHMFGCFVLGHGWVVPGYELPRTRSGRHVTETVEAMTGYRQTTAETLTIIVKAIINRNPMSECKGAGWTRRYL